MAMERVESERAWSCDGVQDREGQVVLSVGQEACVVVGEGLETFS